jgi:hypothetical protein
LGLSSAGHLDWFSRSLSPTGGVPPGVDSEPIPWSEYKKFGLLVAKHAVNAIINKYMPVEVQILNPELFSPRPAEAAEIPSSNGGKAELYSSHINITEDSLTHIK